VDARDAGNVELDPLDQTLGLLPSEDGQLYALYTSLYEKGIVTQSSGASMVDRILQNSTKPNIVTYLLARQLHPSNLSNMSDSITPGGYLTIGTQAHRIDN
jgi:hypothetical protein